MAALSRMGHGDEIVLADAHFPGESCNDRVLRADGVKITQLLGGILKLFPLDTYAESPLFMMTPVEGDTLDPAIEESYRSMISQNCPNPPPITRVERFAFYDRAKEAFAVVMSGDTAKYGNLILKKGVVTD